MKRADKNKRIRDLCNAVMLCCAALALLAVCIVFSVSATFNPFIYFRF